MPDGSSSAAPVTSPGPSSRSTTPREGLDTGRVVSVIECLRSGSDAANLGSLDQTAFCGKVPAGRARAGIRPVAWLKAASADADEGAPGSGQAGADQHIMRIVAERAAITAHVGTERADLVIARGIEQAGEHGERCGDEIHRQSPGCRQFVFR